MADPITNFRYDKNLLVVNFFDLTPNNPTGWAWNFGDGNSSTNQNPSHTYNAEGFYSVTLSATNPDGTTDLTYIIGVSSTGDVLNASLYTLVDAYVPDAMTLDPTEATALIQKWQRYLQNLVEPNIADSDLLNEFRWPPLVNQLIAELVAYDFIVQEANKFAASTTDTSSSTTPGTGNQLIKKIVTGPTEVEYYDQAESISNQASAVASAVKPGGALDTLKEAICQLSKRLRIYLPMCGELVHSPTIPTINTLTTNTNITSGDNPFGVPSPYFLNPPTT